MSNFDRPSYFVTTLILFFYLIGGISLLYWPFNTADFVTLVGFISVQFLGYSILFIRLCIPKMNNLFLILVVTGLGVRLISFYTVPLLEDDFLRYLWDGRVLNAGINPYMFAPDSPSLDHLHTEYRENIGFLNIKTIYPPVAQYVFGLSHYLFGDSLHGLKLVLGFFELLLSACFYISLKANKEQRFLFLLYFLNPLVVFQVYNGVHIDIVAVFFVFLALHLFKQSKKGAVFSGVLLSLGAQVKVFPIVLLPLLLMLTKSKIKLVVSFIVVSILVYIPFLSAGNELFSGFGAFSKEWVFNASIFSLFSYLFTSMGLGVEWARYFVALLFLAVFSRVLWRLNEKSELNQVTVFVVYTLLMLSPVFNAWYLLWVLPFAIVCKEKIVVIHSFLIFAGYSFFEYPHLYPYFVFIEYFVLGVAGAILYRKNQLFVGVLK